MSDKNDIRPDFSRPRPGQKRKKDGRSSHPLYITYHHMLDRCYRPSDKRWKTYGGRGISVCDEWLEYPSGFWRFVEDVGERPDGYSLDRIDNDRGYFKENCRWASNAMQSGNRTNGRKHTGVFLNSSGTYNATITMVFKTEEEAARQRTMWEAVTIGAPDIAEEAMIKAGINLN